MAYNLTDKQYDALRAYFELALTAISDDEDVELISMEPGLRGMLRGLTRTQAGNSTA